MFDLTKIGRRAKQLTSYTAKLSTAEKNRVLTACAAALEANTDYILVENKKDMDNADPARASFNDRLLLTADRVAGMAGGLRKVAALDDPSGEVLYMKTLPNGLQIGERRTPLGVIGMIYEARPNVTVDSFGLCFKAGNVSILRGGSEAICSNTALVKVLQDTLAACSHPREIVQLITDTGREVAAEFMRLNQFVDVLIPRGGPGLIKTTVENSTIPTIETGVGNCHIYADRSADLAQAQAIVINAKTQRPSVCNACEKLLVHKDIAQEFLPKVADALLQKGVEIRADQESLKLLPAAKPATEEDWYTEYSDLIIAVKIVDSPEDAMAHIAKYSSHHSESILTRDYSAAQQFIAEVDSAAVYVNASTRFTDGEEFGMGAEIGISTQKLHARGPMGLKALTSSKFFIFGNGQIRA